MSDIKPGWYSIGDGMFEALWDGETWVEGSKRPTPPGDPTTAAPVTSSDDSPVSSPTGGSSQFEVESFTWRAWVAALSPFALVVSVMALAPFPSISSTASWLIALVLADVACLASVAFAEHALGGGWTAAKVAAGPLWTAPLFAPTAYLRSVDRTRLRAPGWPVALAAMIAAIGIAILASVISIHGDASQAENSGQPNGIDPTTMTCATIADQVVPLVNSRDAQYDPSMPKIVSITSTKILEDDRGSVPVAVGEASTILKCSGVMVAADGERASVVFSAYEKSDNRIYYNFGLK